jgi:hypothetical protein
VSGQGEEDGRLYAPTGSAATGAAAGLAWLWRLGPVLEEPDPRAVGIGDAEQAAELAALVRAGRLAGAVVFASKPGPASAALPERCLGTGVAAFEGGIRLDGEFTLLDGGEPLLRSSLGTHAAVVDRRVLMLAAEASSAWTLLRGYWTLDALARFLPDVLERPLVLLPPVGCVRLDDVPGTAQHQVQGDAHPDRRQLRRIRSLSRAYRRGNAVLNVAVAARALDPTHAELALEEVWPRSVAALAKGVRDGVFEPVGHGYLHLDTEALARGEVEFREFARLDEEEAGQRLDAVLAWQEQTLGRRPETFVAPAWGYSEGTLAAVAARSLHAWRRPAPGPLHDGWDMHETVDSAFRGMRGLDYGAFAAMARVGLPPTPVLHGGLFDLRMGQLRAARDLLGLARLFLRRDVVRLPGLRGLRWIGAGALLGLLQAHESVRVDGAEVSLGEAAGAYLIEPGGGPARPARQLGFQA